MPDRRQTLDFTLTGDNQDAMCDKLLLQLGRTAGDNRTDTNLSPEMQLGLCTQLARAKDPRDLHNQVLEVIGKIGFSDYGFVRMAPSDLESPLLTNPHDQVKSYFEEGYYEHDFMVRYVSQNIRPIFISKVYGVAYDAPYDIDLFRANQKIFELNQSYGYLDYYCIPMMSCRGKAKVMLTVSQRGISSLDFQVNITRHKPTLHVLCEAIDHVTSTKFPNEFSVGEECEPVKINPKPLLVLNTLANNDMTMSAVAEKLCISTITANQHIAAVRRALDTKTTVGAIKKAIKLGLISYT
ncbi:hypothetical protein FKG94_22190 [Exilibacterium tricleocarpae]|uniref:Transcription factor LuxR-like autoinducer-binding domain-containing protein n=1 Tax=Exilibacterium tricleocarpae TaxID=2591008 RepID=A0A545SY24_9GAMM|nr:autoinducer binding domain-containing protein [Exilibacterium tricleocarpae]TQV69865.1 hypothetical protein FKG94_22190 [Exilibacterium tricleocarpae]